MRGRITAWVVGAVVGVVVAVPLALVVQDWQEDREAADLKARHAADAYEDDVPGPVDAIRELLAQDGRVVVDPLLADRVPEADLRRAEEVLAASPTPARIAYLSAPTGLDAGYTTTGAGPQWWTGVGEEGHYVVLWSDGHADSGAVGLEPESLRERTQGQPGPALVRIAEEMATWEAVPLDDAPYEPSDFDYWSGVGGGIGAAALLGILVVLPAFLLARWLVGRARRKAA